MHEHDGVTTPYPKRLATAKVSWADLASDQWLGGLLLGDPYSDRLGIKSALLEDLSTEVLGTVIQGGFDSPHYVPVAEFARPQLERIPDNVESIPEMPRASRSPSATDLTPPGFGL